MSLQSFGQLCDDRMVEKTGSGAKGDPYCYAVVDDGPGTDGNAWFRNIVIHEGNEGANYLSGDEGLDHLFGDGGADTFIFKSDSAFTETDQIHNFNAQDGDKLDIGNLERIKDKLTKYNINTGEQIDAGSCAAIYKGVWTDNDRKYIAIKAFPPKLATEKIDNFEAEQVHLKDISEINLRPHPYELHLYYDA